MSELPPLFSITIPCPACCGEQCTSMECSSRGGTAQICGHEEFTGFVSDPPRYYKRKVFSGSSVICTCVPECVLPSLTVTDCYLTRTVGACTYTAELHIDKIYNSGGKAVIDTTASFTQPGGKCTDMAVQAKMSGLLFVSTGTPGTYKVTADAYGDFTCVGSARTGGSAIGTISCDIPGFGSSQSCSTTQYFPTDVTIKSTILEYTGETTFDPDVSCDVPVLTTGKRSSAECSGYTCVTSLGGCGDLSESSITSAFTDDPYLDSFMQTKDVSATEIYQYNPYDCTSKLERVAQTGSERSETLSQEDTEDDAIARLLAGAGGTWSAYQFVGDGTFMTCINPPCCLAEWQPRVERYIVYKEARFRATQEGLPPGADVEMAITILRKPWLAPDADPWDVFEIQTFSATADGTGKATITGVVPNEKGYKTYASRCTFTSLDDA